MYSTCIWLLFFSFLLVFLCLRATPLISTWPTSAQQSGRPHSPCFSLSSWSSLCLPWPSHTPCGQWTQALIVSSTAWPINESRWNRIDHAFFVTAALYGLSHGFLNCGCRVRYFIGSFMLFTLGIALPFEFLGVFSFHSMLDFSSSHGFLVRAFIDTSSFFDTQQVLHLFIIIRMVAP